MSTEVLLLYLGTWALVAVTPGPAVMGTMSFATRFGFRHALNGIAGIQLGHFVLYGCVASGLAALLATATIAFTVLRIAGAVYLLYLGGRAIAATFRSQTTEQPSPVLPPCRNLFLQGLAIQVTNPKMLLFMSAFMPQFIQPQQPLPLQLSILLATTIAVDVVVLSTYAFVASRGAHSLRAAGITVWLERAFGVALVLFGFRLLAARK